VYPLWPILGCETARDGGRICGLGWRAGHNASHARHSTHSRDAAAVMMEVLSVVEVTDLTRDLTLALTGKVEARRQARRRSPPLINGATDHISEALPE
jgi:hypothetical protein